MRRSLDLTRDLTTLFVCAVSTVLLTRSFLALAGYPQVGGSKFHIAHVLYGGLLLLAACVVSLGFLNPEVKVVAAVLGGVGFGLFIDEVGKFVTKNVDYFYRPAIAIIYVCFVVLFGVIRWLSRKRFSPQETTLIGLEALQRAATGTLSEQRRSRILALMLETGDPTGLAQQIRDLLEQATSEPQPHPPISQRLSRLLASRWTQLSRHPLFRQIVFAALIVAAAVSAGEVAWLLRDGIGHLSFSQRAFTLTTIIADAALFIGAIELRTSLLSALHWYDHAVLLEITVGQVFLYTSEQLAATLNLVALLTIWTLISTAIHFESAHNASELLTRQPGGTTAATA